MISIELQLHGVPPALNSAPAYGVSVHLSSVVSDDLARIQNAGLNWIRTDFFWDSIERSVGTYDFTAYDAQVSKFQANKLQPLFILDYGNRLYANPGDVSPYTSRANTDGFRAGYAAFSAAAVAHYAGRGFIWEQWNEPNNGHLWAPTPDSAAYISLVKQAAIEIRKKYPNEILVGPATAGIDLTFIEACLKGGMLDYWSAISVHPYRHSAPETAAKDFANLRALIAKYAVGGRIVPIICSEWGYSTAWTGIDDSVQADYLSRMFLFSVQQNFPVTIWYDWRDDGDDPTNQEHRFGLVRRSLTGAFDPKPAYFAAGAFLTGALITVPNNARVKIQVSP
jgi:hypothetical protein